jgi:hypothetical protein
LASERGRPPTGELQIGSGNMAFRLIPLACLLFAIPGSAIAQGQLDSVALSEMQKHFADAYNSSDADAMAAGFMENAIRVTPSGIF